MYELAVLDELTKIMTRLTAMGQAATIMIVIFTIVFALAFKRHIFAVLGAVLVGAICLWAVNNTTTLQNSPGKDFGGGIIRVAPVWTR